MSEQNMSLAGALIIAFFLVAFVYESMDGGQEYPDCEATCQIDGWQYYPDLAYGQCWCDLTMGVPLTGEGE